MCFERCVRRSLEPGDKVRDSRTKSRRTCQAIANEPYAPHCPFTEHSFHGITPFLKKRGKVYGTNCHPRVSPLTSVNTRLFSLFPFSGIVLKRPFWQPLVNFTFSRIPLHSRQSEAS
jgi:hypothetical protein